MTAEHKQSFVSNWQTSQHLRHEYMLCSFTVKNPAKADENDDGIEI